jgi:hypothetical protein
VLTLRQAAVQAKTSRSSLHRDVQRGRISVTRGESGQILIDPSELARVYGSGRSSQPSQPSHAKPSSQGQDGTGRPKTLDAETAALTAALQAKVEALEGLVSRLDRDKEDLKRLMEDLRQDRDSWRGQAERLALAPPPPSPSPAPPRRSWWPWRAAQTP